MPASDETKKLKNKAKASLTLLLVAVISITTATYAWFTLSNSATVQSMEVKVGTGTKLMVSTSDSGTAADPWNGYSAELDNSDIDDLLQRATGYTQGLSDIRLWPLTSGNGYRLYTESGNTTGTPVNMESKYYLELSLWFRSSVNMNVYLNKDNSPNTVDDDGTKVWSDEATATRKKVEEAVRLSFTDVDAGSAVIYEPNKPASGTTTLHGQAAIDAGGATQATFMTLGDNDGTGTGNGDDPPVVFSLRANEPKNIVIRVWIEGEDPQCVNGNGTGDDAATNLEEAMLKVRFRFCGADDNGKYIENTVA